MDQNSRHISSLKEILQLDVWEHRKRSEERGTLWGTSLPVAFDDHPNVLWVKVTCHKQAFQAEEI